MQPSRHVSPPAGPVLFARYAYPPNQLGYCGPEDHGALLDYGAAQVSDPGLVQLARAFTGPWPYLRLIAGAAGIDDPFDRRVVEAYWIGNGLLDRVAATDFGKAVWERFRRVAGRRWDHLAEAIPAGAVAHHSFHVFGVYPWVGLLESGRSDHPLHQLDRCRIRWGRVVTSLGDQVLVRARLLQWDGSELSLGEPEPETVARAVDGLGFVEDLQPGDWVSMHWDWVCDRLDQRQLTNLRRYTTRQLEITNRRVAHSGPGMVMAGGR
ncbi:MAG: hypothetical protein KY462_00760 [Actinobacteria bacterium]|nr:hypothetical protein [Actinomycetota bacterium]